MTAVTATSSFPPEVRALLDPSIYPHPVPEVAFTQTHISWVFLAGDRVYKMKKPVDFGFCNFTTLARRRYYCRREVELNRRLAPDVYLGVETLRKTASGYSLTGKGRVIDYLVVMRRLDDDRSLKRMVKTGRTTPADLVRIGRTLADFHRRARRSPAIDRYGLPSKIGYNVRENFSQIGPYLGRTISETRFRNIRDLTLAFLKEKRGFFRSRVKDKKIVEGHGDLHTSHVYLIDDRVVVLDGIEFNLRFLYQDPAADLAFLLMDLDYLGRSDLGWVVLDAYLDYSGDYDLVPLLPFYESYRAFVRGKVASFMTGGGGVPKEMRRAKVEEATRYFDLAESYLVPSKPGKVIIVSGPSGSGKSTLARGIVPLVGAVHLRSDVIRKVTAGMAPEESTTPADKDWFYSAAVSKDVYHSLAVRAGELYRLGFNVIADATFLRDEHRLNFLREAGVPPEDIVLITLQAPPGVMADRLRKADAKETLSEADPEVLRNQLRGWEPPGENWPTRVIELTGDEPADEVARRIFEPRLGSNKET